ncbi:hypothetical protein EOPP23_07345 [Endozoicomonas sp. OPT23]|uniref:hypothetical protein n=1 Tax=Endozoicomonas sp. OPT23 TaxID=2072845 RepID=UPI00129B8932|nr:hypothetical protein [Endozoicomonas sp. OPT23]MRI32797.1 hypothetical protein [Endozoicomonas sp. OPT23]
MRKIYLIAAMLLSLSLNTQAYTYSAAGKEPLIDGREALIQAANSNDFVAASKAYQKVEEEVLYFKQEYGIDLDTPMRNALKAKDASKVTKVLNKIYVAEINRRLTGAEKNINDYQVAKVLVVKSKLFLDLLTPQMSAEQREQANEGIQGALKAVGNPGVFGVGAAPADPDTMKQSHTKLMQALKIFQ